MFPTTREGWPDWCVWMVEAMVVRLLTSRGSINVRAHVVARNRATRRIFDGKYPLARYPRPLAYGLFGNSETTRQSGRPPDHL